MFVLLCTWYFFDFVLTHALCHLILAHLLENRVDVTVDWPSMHPILRRVVRGDWSALTLAHSLADSSDLNHNLTVRLTLFRCDWSQNCWWVGEVKRVQGLIVSVRGILQVHLLFSICFTHAFCLVCCLLRCEHFLIHGYGVSCFIFSRGFFDYAWLNVKLCTQ